MDPRGSKMIFVGYTSDHTYETYQMFNPQTGRIILSGDIRWLNIYWNGHTSPNVKYLYEAGGDIVKNSINDGYFAPNTN